MLSLRPNQDRLMRADNFLPEPSGRMASRAGAIQTIGAAIGHATDWDDFTLYQSGDRIYVEDTDIGGFSKHLSGTVFQALTADANRENRLYVADGGSPLWYVTRESGVFAVTYVVNEITNDSGTPYDAPTATVVASWRNRVWAGLGTNRIQHSNFDAPSAYDPLNTLEFQTGQQDNVLALQAHGEALIVGLGNSLWAVTGESEYNWRRDKIVDRRGVTGLGGLASDGNRLFYLSRSGLFQYGQEAPIAAAELEPLMGAPDPRAQIELAPDGETLWLFLRGRLLVLRLADNNIGEVAADGIQGILRTADGIGWFGDNGAWLLGSKDAPDSWLDGRKVAVETTLETWDARPNPQGRDVLKRVYLSFYGSDEGTGTYTAVADAEDVYSENFELADRDGETAFEFWDRNISAGTVPLVSREFAPAIGGRIFRHRIETNARIDLVRFDPQYKTRLEA